MHVKFTDRIDFDYICICIFFRNKLEGSVDQWMEYDNKYEGLSQWIKDMEGKVRNEGNLKSDLPGKTQQAEHFSVCI